MNLSGRAIRQVSPFTNGSRNKCSSSTTTPPCRSARCGFREKGSAGGHNGIKSIIEHLGTDAFPRLKIGIGSSQPGNMTGHVLGKFSPDERPLLENTLATALEAVQLARSQGIAAAANRYHTRIHPPQPQSDESQIPRPDRP